MFSTQSVDDKKTSSCVLLHREYPIISLVLANKEALKLPTQHELLPDFALLRARKTNFLWNVKNRLAMNFSADLFLYVWAFTSSVQHCFITLKSIYLPMGFPRSPLALFGTYPAAVHILESQVWFSRGKGFTFGELCKIIYFRINYYWPNSNLIA